MHLSYFIGVGRLSDTYWAHSEPLFDDRHGLTKSTSFVQISSKLNRSLGEFNLSERQPGIKPQSLKRFNPTMKVTSIPNYVNHSPNIVTLACLIV
jgi:hypothetical protein